MDGEVLGGWVVDVGREARDKIAWLWLFVLKDGIEYLGIEFAALFGAWMGGDYVYGSRRSFLGDFGGFL